MIESRKRSQNSGKLGLEQKLMRLLTIMIKFIIESTHCLFIKILYTKIVQLTIPLIYHTKYKKKPLLLILKD